MSFLKLNIRRFEDVEIANLITTVSINDQTGNSKNVINNMDKMGDSISRTVAKIEQLENATTKGRSKQTQLSNSTALEQFAKLKEQLATTQNLSMSPVVSDKFLADAETKLTKLRILMDNVVANKYSKTDLNQFATLSGAFAKMNISEHAKQMKSFGDATQQSSNYVSRFSDNINKASNNSSKFTQIMKKIAGAAVRWRIVYGAVRAVWNTISTVVDKAAAYEEAINLYTVALGNYAEEASKWRDKIAEALHLDPRYIMQYTGALFNLVQGLGVSEKAAYTMSTNLTQLAYDMSSYLNIDVESAYAKIQSAMTGQSRAVASAGIAMQQASLQELAYSLGIKENVADMTQAEKTYLRYIQIMRSTVKMQGDLGRTIVTPENAIRIMRQQFELLARAIGQVFIPIIMKAIPYVMAFTKVLTNLAKRLAEMLGFEMADIDYSSLTTADTAVEDTFDNIDKKAKGTSNSVKDSINRTLAAFDELNVVESESKGAGGGGVGGGIPSTDLSKLEPYITGYDMLQGLTDELDKKVDSAMKNLEKFWSILKKIGAAFLIFKTLKGLSQLALFVDNIKELYDKGKGLPGLFKKLVNPISTMIGKFKEAYNASVAFGNKGLTAVSDGIRNALGPVGSAVAGFAAIGASFISAEKIMYNFDVATDSALATTTKVTAAVGALTLAAGVFLGPVGAVAAGVAGLTGVLLGATEQINDYKRQLEEKVVYDNLFSGIGISADTIATLMDNASGKLQEYCKQLGRVRDEYDSTDTKLQESKQSFEDLHELIMYGWGDETSVDKLKVSLENLKTNINNNRDAAIKYNDTLLKHFKDEGYISEKTYNGMIADIKKWADKKALYTSEYYDQIAKLDIQLENGKISQEEYNKKVGELQKAYAGIVPEAENVSNAFENLYGQQVFQIDFKNPKELKNLVDKLKKSYDDGKTSIEEQKKAAEEYYDIQITKTQKALDENRRMQEETDKSDKKRLENLKKIEETLQGELNSNIEARKTAMDGFKQDAEGLDAQYYNFMSTIYAQIKQNGGDTLAGVSETTKGIKKELEENLGKVDLDKAGYNSLQKYVDGVYKAGKELNPELIHFFKQNNQKLGSEGTQALIDETEKKQKEYDKAMFHFNDGVLKDGPPLFKQTAAKLMKPFGDEMKIKQQELSTDATGFIKQVNEKMAKEAEKDTNSKKTGANIVKGQISGMKSEEGNLLNTFKDSNTNLINNTKKQYQIGSPSKLFEEFGKFIMQGFKNGLTSQEATVLKYFTDLLTKIKNKTENTKVNLKFSADADVKKSFNSILEIEQSFANKWRNGINDIMSATKKAFAGLSLDGSSNLVYAAMKSIKISKFAEGGYPTSGDLFLANENGRAEYITSLGNRTAVANQDQMISALTNAILQGMSAIETNRQPGVTQVYIGNEKIYEGQGQYQNRQAERYGTAIVKI